MIVDAHVLLCRVDGSEHDFLPGGHIELGEGAHESLRREMLEELGDAGTGTQVGRYLGAVEHAYASRGERRHEVNHCFEATIPLLSAARAPQSPEAYLQFRWQRLDALRSIDLRPRPVIDLVLDGRDGGPRWFSTIPSEEIRERE